MIFLTGATGTVGSEVARMLISTGAEVRALVRDPLKATALQKRGIELAVGTLDKPETLETALTGVETALILSPSAPNQLHLQCCFVDAARQAGIRHIVKLSGASASEDNPQQFARWHWQVEQYIRKSGIPFTFVQPVYFMQNFLGKDTAQMIARQSRFAAPLPADLRFTMVDARDVAAVTASVLSERGHEGQTYVVTGLELLSSNEQAELLSSQLGKPVKFMEVSQETFRNLLLNAGQPSWLVEGVIELFANVDTYTTDTVINVAKKAPFTFEEFLRDHLETFKL